jgi:5-methylcytosine-specific restriction protein A
MNPPESRLRVRLKARPHGRAPAKFGRDTFKFTNLDARLLTARQWREVGGTPKFRYLTRSDAGSEAALIVDVLIPELGQIIEFAEELHGRGKMWIGRIGEWDALYRPNKTPYPITSFIVGSPGLWSVRIRWENGVAIPEEENSNIVSRGPTLFDPPLAALPGLLKRPIDDSLFEGALDRVTNNRYERNIAARQACIAHFGAVCSICGIEFAKVYGPVAAGFIHVHHMLPLSAIGEEYRIDPIRDLTPLCPNCHAVVHLSDPPYTIAEAKLFLQRR